MQNTFFRSGGSMEFDALHYMRFVNFTARVSTNLTHAFFLISRMIVHDFLQIVWTEIGVSRGIWRPFKGHFRVSLRAFRGASVTIRWSLCGQNETNLAPSILLFQMII